MKSQSTEAVLVPVIAASIAPTIPGARRVGDHYLAPEEIEIELGSMGAFTIGRSREASLQLDIKDISRQHAQITCAEGQYRLSDCGSLNGTFLNGARLGPHSTRALGDCDLLRFGARMVYMLQIRPTSQLAEETMFA